eukprot:GHVU01061183.1.p2 GENE.GHVU01061183.1~~GHVU01061183.1.p2  ORF type:complete len:108 (+),score=3.42 GHVU01061183.1:927-1250(+)
MATPPTTRGLSLYHQVANTHSQNPNNIPEGGTVVDAGWLHHSSSMQPAGAPLGPSLSLTLSSLLASLPRSLTHSHALSSVAISPARASERVVGERTTEPDRRFSVGF